MHLTLNSTKICTFAISTDTTAILKLWYRYTKAVV